MTIDNFAVSEKPSRSVIPAVKVNVPAPPGVPEMIPVCEFNARPLGRLPEVRYHLKGAAPSPATTGAEYGTPVCPAGKIVVEIRTTSFANAFTDIASKPKNENIKRIGHSHAHRKHILIHNSPPNQIGLLATNSEAALGAGVEHPKCVAPGHSTYFRM